MNKVKLESLSKIFPLATHGAHLLIRIALVTSAVWTAVIASELAIRGIAQLCGKRGADFANFLSDYHLRPLGSKYSSVGSFEHKTLQLAHAALQIALATAFLWEFTDRQFGSVASLSSRLMSLIRK